MMMDGQQCSTVISKQVEALLNWYESYRMTQKHITQSDFNKPPFHSSDLLWNKWSPLYGRSVFFEKILTTSMTNTNTNANTMTMTMTKQTYIPKEEDILTECVDNTVDEVLQEGRLKFKDWIRFNFSEFIRKEKNGSDTAPFGVEGESENENENENENHNNNTPISIKSEKDYDNDTGSDNVSQHGTPDESETDQLDETNNNYPNEPNKYSIKNMRNKKNVTQIMNSVNHSSDSSALLTENKTKEQLIWSPQKKRFQYQSQSQSQIKLFDTSLFEPGTWSHKKERERATSSNWWRSDTSHKKNQQQTTHTTQNKNLHSNRGDYSKLSVSAKSENLFDVLMMDSSSSTTNIIDTDIDINSSNTSNTENDENEHTTNNKKHNNDTHKETVKYTTCPFQPTRKPIRSLSPVKKLAITDDKNKNKNADHQDETSEERQRDKQEDEEETERDKEEQDEEEEVIEEQRKIPFCFDRLQRRQLTQACWAQRNCKDSKCIRIHGEFDPEQEEEYQQNKSNVVNHSLWGYAACADFFSAKGCHTTGMCTYRHFVAGTVRTLREDQKMALFKRFGTTNH
jgi:hypothetical protein